MVVLQIALGVVGLQFLLAYGDQLLGVSSLLVLDVFYFELRVSGLSCVFLPIAISVMRSAKPKVNASAR